jgi:hypothetical protein
VLEDVDAVDDVGAGVTGGQVFTGADPVIEPVPG